MAVTTVWGFLPVFVGESEDNWGHANGPFVRVPANTPEDSPMMNHEKVHVKQFYATFFVAAALCAAFVAATAICPYAWVGTIAVVIGTALFSRLPYFDIRSEAAAYGESIRTLNPSDPEKAVRYYADVLNGPNYKENYDIEKLRDLVRDRYESGSLF